MRIFFAIILASSTSAFAVCSDPCNCTGPNSIIADSYSCTNLSLSGNLTVTPNGTNILSYSVSGTTTISGNLNLNGSTGLIGDSDFTVTRAGGLPGPGGFAGGNYTGSFGGSNPGDGLEINCEGKAGADYIPFTGDAFGGGGGGGGFNVNRSPKDGTLPFEDGVGQDTAAVVGEGGAPVVAITAANIPTTTTLRGGCGGGAGGMGSDIPTANAPGTGGGGGGVFRLLAEGPVSITGSVNADGGSGGTGFNYGGGGGAGAGGIIHIRSTKEITIDGSLSAIGGNGGQSTLSIATAPIASYPNQKATGGNGAYGFIVLEDADGTISGTWSPPINVSTNALGGGNTTEDGGNSGEVVSTNEKLTSGISCGSLKENSLSLFSQAFIGFMLIILSGSMRKLKIFSKT